MADVSTTRTLSLRVNSMGLRAQRFGLTHTLDATTQLRLRDTAYTHKLSLISSAGIRSGLLAGYDPAGAGSPWYSIGPRNVNGRVKSLAVHPTDPNTVYAGAASGGVWKSSDGGQTWNPLWDMQQSLAIGALGIAKSAPNTIYAGTGEWTPGWGPSYGGAGVFVSTDGGATWTQRPAVKSRHIGKLVVDPTNPQRLWTCGDAGLELSTDGGVTWTTLKTGTITDIVLDPTNPNTMLIAIASDGIYRSTNSGTTFTQLTAAPSGSGLTWPQLAQGVSGTHGHNFIVVKYGDTIQTSINGGTTFTTVPGSHGGFYAGWCDVVACAPDNESILFWGGVSLDYTANGGTSWTSQPVHADQHVAVFAPSNTSVVYIANDGGVWRSNDKGATISKVSNGLVITQFYNINFWSTLSNVIGGGAQDNQTNWTTGGLTWQPTYGGDGGWFVIDPLDPRTMYAEYQNASIAKSTDGGQTWTSKSGGITGNTPWEGVLTMDPNNHLRLFYGTNYVLRSNDALATNWVVVSQALTGEVSAIAVAPSNSNYVYAATGSGKIYLSTNGGNTSTWTDISGTLPARPITSVAVDATSPNTVMVTIGATSGAASAQAVYRSINANTAGTTWTDVSGDLPQVVANAVAIDPSSPATIWYVATDTGLYRSANSGANWTPFDNGIPNVVVSDLAVDPKRKILYCATMGRGAYKLDITPGITKPKVDIYVRDDDLDTGEIFPSPSNVEDPLLPSGNAWWWLSPDIKVNHAPVYAPTGVFDGVLFDTVLIHQDPWRGASNRFYVQVTNRGWQATTNVSVRAFLADASIGLPALPNALVPPAFNLSSTTNWTPVGAAQTIASLVPNRPAVVTWNYTLPITAATHTCCLVAISCPDDPLTNTSTNVGTLVSMDKRVALHNLHVVDVGQGPMVQMMLSLDFHNTLAAASTMDIVIYPHGFERGAISLLLPSGAPAALQDVNQVSVPAGANLGQFYVSPGLVKSASATSIETLRTNLSSRLKAIDATRAFQFNPARMSRVNGVPVAAGGVLQGTLVVSHKLDMPLPAPPSFDVVQIQGEKVVGGSTYVIGTPLPLLHKPLSFNLTTAALVLDGVTAAD
jgi:hypothetical protein